MRFRQSLGPLSGTLALVLASGTTVADETNSALHTEFGEVHLQNLAIGRTYSVAHLAREQFVVSNTGDDSIAVHMEAAVPRQHELRPEALPVPDRNWVRLENSDLVLPAHATVRIDVYLTLPYDPDLAGKLFQVDILSRDVQRGRDTQRHRLLFTVEMDPEDDTEWTFSMRSLHRRPLTQ
jgi:hypothetical protein